MPIKHFGQGGTSITGDTQRSTHRWAMHSNELLPLLGVQAGGHLPKDGLPIREVLGVQVYVLPAFPTTGRRKSSRHRVMAVCPVCAKHMSAGRLASQHFRKMHRGVTTIPRSVTITHALDAIVDALPLIPSVDALCHDGVCGPGDCARCQRIKAAHVGVDYLRRLLQ